ncbi:MAG: hypothetical protein OHK0029_04790 [Armatimonadaceae bacterium]
MLLTVTGIGFWIAGIPWVGVPFCLLGSGAGIWHAMRLQRTRPPREDPYDLSKLWDYDPLDPIVEETIHEEDMVRANSDGNGTLYCQHCGHAVPDLFAFCPECGNRLG